jgi:hypothetical protein
VRRRNNNIARRTTLAGAVVLLFICLLSGRRLRASTGEEACYDLPGTPPRQALALLARAHFALEWKEPGADRAAIARRLTAAVAFDPTLPHCSCYGFARGFGLTMDLCGVLRRLEPKPLLLEESQRPASALLKRLQLYRDPLQATVQRLHSVETMHSAFDPLLLGSENLIRQDPIRRSLLLRGADAKNHLSSLPCATRHETIFALGDDVHLVHRSKHVLRHLPKEDDRFPIDEVLQRLTRLVTTAVRFPVARRQEDLREMTRPCGAPSIPAARSRPPNMRSRRNTSP